MPLPQPCLISSLFLADLLQKLHITRFDEIGSTSDLVIEATKNGAAEGTAFRADIQTSGRGRHGRDWTSPKGNLYCSVLLRPQRPLQEWPSLSLVASLALRDAIADFRNSGRVRLKWPNDVLLDDRKVAGLLLEVHEGAVVLGCGVNCMNAPAKTTGWAAGFLNQQADDPAVDADMVMESLAVRLCDRYNNWQKFGFATMVADWIDAAAHIGMVTEARQSNGETVTGVFETLSSEGSMLLRLADGSLREMTAGDVLRARPEGN